VEILGLVRALPKGRQRQGLEAQILVLDGLHDVVEQGGRRRLAANLHPQQSQTRLVGLRIISNCLRYHLLGR